MPIITQSYPSTSTQAVTITLASLTSGAAGVYEAGREGAAVVNSNNDLDHVLRGHITVGSSVTANRRILIYAFIPRSIASGAPTWPDQMTGADAARNVTSANVRLSALRLVAGIAVDSTASRVYDFSGVSVAGLFGAMPSRYGIYVTHDTGSALAASGHSISFERVQMQST